MYTDVGDPLETCPYEKAHQIRHSRMQTHLVKCRKNHPTADMKICPFNATHHIPTPDYQYHRITCPNQMIIEHDVYRLEDELPSGDLSAAPFHVPEIPCEENWEEETASGYDPRLRMGPPPTFTSPQGATKSGRKDYRLQHRRQQQELAEQRESEGPVDSTSSISLEKKTDYLIGEVKVPREPKTRSLALQRLLPRTTGRGGAVNPSDDIPDEVLASLGNMSLGRPLGRGNPFAQTN